MNDWHEYWEKRFGSRMFMARLDRFDSGPETTRLTYAATNERPLKEWKHLSPKKYWTFSFPWESRIKLTRFDGKERKPTYKMEVEIKL